LVQGGKVRVQFRAADSFSIIKRGEYSLDAGEWHFVEPVGQLSDAKTESYDFTLPIPEDQSGQEHVVVVRAYDKYDNMNSAKTVVPGSKFRFLIPSGMLIIGPSISPAYD
jgi:hypothetical protein